MLIDEVIYALYAHPLRSWKFCLAKLELARYMTGPLRKMYALPALIKVLTGLGNNIDRVKTTRRASAAALYRVLTALINRFCTW